VKPESPAPAGDASAEISALIETLLATEQRLEELTLGEVDTVTGSDGRTFTLRRAQEHVRHRDAGKQATLNTELRVLFDLVPAMIWFKDTQDRILRVNQRVADVAGKSIAEIEGKPSVESYPQEAARHYEDDLEVIHSGRPKLGIVETIRNRDGEMIWIQTDKIPYRDEDGKVIGIVVMAQDITERKLTAEALRASQANMAIAQRIAHFGSWELELVDTNGAAASTLRWSDEMYRIAGYEPGGVDVSNELFFRNVHPDDHAAIRQAMATAIREHQEYSVVHRFIRPDGQERIVQELAQIFYDEKTGQPLKVVGTAHDVTESKRAEEAMRASESEFRALAEAMPQIVWVTRPDGWNTYFNQQWTVYTGLSPEESRGHGWSKPFHPDDQQRAADAWRQATATGGSYSLECRLRRADGVYRWWLIRGVPVRDASGEILKWFGTCTDIDEFKVAQARIEEQATLLDIAHEAILVRDLDDRIIYWNKGAERIFGWSSGEAIGRPATQLLNPDSAVIEKAMATLMAKGEWQGEVMKRTKAGREITVDVGWTLVRDTRGWPKAILDISTDITQKKMIEGQFLRAQRMEGIGTLAGGIAHDLNNVLAPILMAIDILKAEVKNDYGLSLLDTVRNSANRGAELVKQVLSFARGVESMSVQINLTHILREIKGIVRDTFPKSITFNLRSAVDLWTVNGDPTQLHQVVMNLCVNARDAMPNGGSLNLNLENIRLDETYAGMNPEANAGAYVVVTVEDTGSGITPEIRDKIFEPFFTTKEIGKGTGLGLSTTLAIVKSHGGFINLYSERNKGTRFKVFLPANTTATAAEVATVEHIRLPRGHGEWVLVVDDEPGIRVIAEKTLERYGYGVLVAGNGAEAVALYAQHRSKIAVVLTDMAMPVMDGPATIIALRSMNPAVKIIGSSGLTSAGGVAKAVGAGVTQFLHKPYSAETLLKALSLTLSKAERPAKWDSAGQSGSGLEPL
jgi:PAS domain S-box-containing protein